MFLIYFSNFLYVLLFMPAAYIIEKIGVRWSLFGACAISILGTWIPFTSDQTSVKVLGELMVDVG